MTDPSPEDVFLTQTSLLQTLDDHPELESTVQSAIRKQATFQELGFQHTHSPIAKRLNLVDIEEVRARKLLEARAYAEEQEKRRTGKEEERQEYVGRAKRHWQATMRKITFQPPSEDYYQTCPLKPGFGFFRLLAMAVRSGKRLAVHIPTSILLSDERYLLWTEEGVSGPVVRSEADFRIADILRKFESCRLRTCPAAVLRMPDGPASCLKAVPLHYYEFCDKLIRSQYPSQALVQLFISSQAGRPAVTRLFYPARSRPLSSSLAFIITATDAGLKRPYGKYILLGETLDGFEAYPMAGQALSSYEAAAREVVQFLESAYRVRIDDIVLDFMPDTKGRIWLIGCKGLTVNAATETVKAIRHRQTTGLDSEQLRELYSAELDDKLTSTHCKLCQLLYSPRELTQVLPYQTLLLFKRHCEKSGRDIPNLSHLKACSVQALVHWVRLCDICYMLVRQEFELVETERRLARALHIPVEQDNFLVQKQVSQPSFMPAKLEQWRVLFYFKGLEVRERTGGQLGVEFELFGRRNGLQLGNTWEQETVGVCHASNLLYFFAASASEALKLCQSTEVTFHIKHSSHSLCQGQCKPLANFSCHTALLPAVCEPLTLLLFSGTQLWGSLHLVVGLTCDRVMRVKDLPISFTRHMNVYIPEPSYCNSEPLPEAWLEQFTKEYKGLERTDVVSTSRMVEQMYSPRLRDREIFGGDLRVQSLSPRQGTGRRVGGRTERLETGPDLYEELMSLTRRIHYKGYSARTTPAPPSLSTTASAKVLYAHAKGHNLMSPTFISSRYPSSQRFLTTDSTDSLKDTEGIETWKELSGSVERYLKLRTETPKSQRK